MAHDVFISYSTEDKTTADAVCAFLESRRVRCWIAPRDIPPGCNWAASIMDALTATRTLVVVCSMHASSSAQVLREVHRAVSIGLVIIPFRIDAKPLSKDLSYLLGPCHWLDALTPPLEQHIRNLADVVSAVLTASANVPAAAQSSSPHAAPSSPNLVDGPIDSRLARVLVSQLPQETQRRLNELVNVIDVSFLAGNSCDPEAVLARIAEEFAAPVIVSKAQVTSTLQEAAEASESYHPEEGEDPGTIGYARVKCIVDVFEKRIMTKQCARMQLSEVPESQVVPYLIAQYFSHHWHTFTKAELIRLLIHGAYGRQPLFALQDYLLRTPPGWWDWKDAVSSARMVLGESFEEWYISIKGLSSAEDLRRQQEKDGT